MFAETEAAIHRATHRQYCRTAELAGLHALTAVQDMYQLPFEGRPGRSPESGHWPAFQTAPHPSPKPALPPATTIPVSTSESVSAAPRPQLQGVRSADD